MRLRLSAASRRFSASQNACSTLVPSKSRFIVRFRLVWAAEDGDACLSCGQAQAAARKVGFEDLRERSPNHKRLLLIDKERLTDAVHKRHELVLMHSSKPTHWLFCFVVGEKFDFLKANSLPHVSEDQLNGHPQRK